MTHFGRKLAAGAALVCMALMVQSARADDMIDNPAYASWSKCKAGSTVKYTTDSEAMGNKSSMETTMTLTDISPEKATVESKVTMVVAGNKMDMPAQKMEIVAKIKKPDAPTATATDAPKPETGSDDVKVGEKSYACKWTKTATDQNGMKTNAKTWTCDEVPGGLVKMETETSGNMTATVKMTLVSVDAK